MTSRFFLPLRLAALALALAGPALAQGRAPTPIRAPTGGTGTATGGGGTGGGFSGNTQRQYPNTTLLGDATISSDLETRRLIVVTDESTNENIRAVIQSLDRPKPQVLINVVFLQVSHDKGLDLGAEALYNGEIAIKGEPQGIAQSKFGIAAQLADPTAYGAFYRILGRDVTATIHALSQVTKTEILSRPSVLTRSSQQATIMVGQSVPIITNSRVSDQTNTTINTVTYQDIGIILRVTPFITEKGLVEMIVRPEISSLSATTVPISNTVNSPVIDKRSADTVVVTQSDQTVVIGGLISTQSNDQDRKIPLLGDIPLLGAAFKRKVKNDVKTELLIFLTPHVVQQPGDLARITAEERAKLNLAPKTFEKLELDRFIDPPPAKN